jgi:hypothetical protein
MIKLSLAKERFVSSKRCKNGNHGPEMNSDVGKGNDVSTYCELKRVRGQMNQQIITLGKHIGQISYGCQTITAL